MKLNDLALNISMTKSITLTSSHKLSSAPKSDLYMSGEPMQQVDQPNLHNYCKSTVMV